MTARRLRKLAKRHQAWALLFLSLSACDNTTTPTHRAERKTGARASASATSANIFQPERVEFSGSAMGTSVTVVSYTTPSLNPTHIERAIEAAMVEIKRLEALMSSWRPDSEVSKLNQAQGQFVAVSPETFEVIQQGLWAASISEGTFDITFQALSGLWKFGDAQDASPQPPKHSDVQRLKQLVDYRRVQVDAKTRSVKLGPRQQIGLGGVAKGYIVDKAAKVLRDAGLSAFLLRAGGDLYGAGKKPDGQPWVAGIQDPRGSNNNYFATLELTDHAFSTAGDYARAYVFQGKRYHHIIDPRTGYPATQCRSVTIWAPSALLADVVDDSVFILGPEKGLKLVESLEGVGAVVVDTENKVFISQRLQGKVQLLAPPTPGE